MAFKARKVKKGFFEIHGVEQFIDKRWRELDRKIEELRRSLGGAKKTRPAARQAPKAALHSGSPVDHLITALEQHPRRAELIRAGKKKDQLLRALIPLYLGRSAKVEISSGTTSKLWANYGVKFAAPNAAKALREHAGYARRAKNGGPLITPTGIKYVEGALGGKGSSA